LLLIKDFSHLFHSPFAAELCTKCRIAKQKKRTRSYNKTDFRLKAPNLHKDHFPFPDEEADGFDRGGRNLAGLSTNWAISLKFHKKNPFHHKILKNQKIWQGFPQMGDFLEILQEILCTTRF
jgi:hypothetical protein